MGPHPVVALQPIFSVTVSANAVGRRALLGEQMERAFAWDAPDFSTMAESEARTWWMESITFPDEFSYVSPDGA